MGGKSSSAPPPVVQPGPDYNQLALLMQQASAGGGGGGGAMPAMPVMPDIPEIERVEPVDWREKQKEINEKMAGEFASDTAGMHGRAATVLTDPSLDGVKATTTAGKLKGGGTKVEEEVPLGDTVASSTNLLGM